MLDIDWRTHGSKEYFRQVRETMEEMAEALGGRMQHNPLGYLSRVVTVHPLGGCPMGRAKGDGVVDSHGEVYGHPGLYVADGSVMPGPVGPNPSLTIAALADRFADHIIEKRRRVAPVRRAPRQEVSWEPAPM
jgi:cholesterol oxidase